VSGHHLVLLDVLESHEVTLVLIVLVVKLGRRGCGVHLLGIEETTHISGRCGLVEGLATDGS
jgi:hypothetical protein